MNFSLNLLTGKYGSLPGQPAGGRFLITIPNQEGRVITVCTIDHWALDSCGLASLFGFGRDYEANEWWNNQENVEAFVTYLTTLAFPCDNWQPKEYIFSVATWQLKTYMNKLVSHPKVKRMDRFINKAHGPAHIYLYRLSIQEDFSYLNKTQKEEE